MDDKSILQHITELVEEENRLRADTQAPDQNRARIEELEVQLDQCWDLLRQRRARREFGQNPDDAQVRDKDTVEKYIQ
ncbi:DUF2630 family protein [uncultured Azohydromonas sp.]|uniref:DUF2630 family protein n=1 Tax=uncultured Azohydromonas sp. TaxID=487342 RepID=UPI0026353764|nr:DUF2630 family protein [uncultured Azohydromonas sp.]